VRAAADAAWRWSVFSRFVAAAAGGYGLVTLIHLALTTVLPVEQYKALLFSHQTGYLYYTGVFIWCFAARTAGRAWLGLALLAVPLALIDAGYLIHRSLS
jgi:hypothetical protein